MKNFFLKTNVFILFFLGFISCNKDDEEKIIVPNQFVGEWEAVWDEYTGDINDPSEGRMLVFNKDMTCKMNTNTYNDASTQDLTYTFNDSLLTIRRDIGDFIYYYDFMKDGKELMLDYSTNTGGMDFVINPPKTIYKKKQYLVIVFEVTWGGTV